MKTVEKTEISINKTKSVFMTTNGFFFSVCFSGFLFVTTNERTPIENTVKWNFTLTTQNIHSHATRSLQFGCANVVCGIFIMLVY